MTRTATHLAAGLFLLTSLAQFSPAAPAPGSLLPGGPSKWKLTWSEEFDGPDAKLDERWVAQNGPSGHILCSRWRENVKVADGMLRLINRKEKRGGQQWTSGSIWTKEHFQYGYFECRYRCAAAEGTNNSFWLMTQHKTSPAKGKSFEIDINEGHFPNKINTNIHNWSDIKVVNGKKTHPSASKSFSFGIRPDATIQPELPVRTKRIRLTSNHGPHFHLGEFRIYNVNPGGYPDPLTKSADKDKPGLVNFARDAKIRTSGFFKSGQDTSAKLVDGDIGTKDHRRDRRHLHGSRSRPFLSAQMNQRSIQIQISSSAINWIFIQHTGFPHPIHEAPQPHFDSCFRNDRVSFRVCGGVFA